MCIKKRSVIWVSSVIVHNNCVKSPLCFCSVVIFLGRESGLQHLVPVCFTLVKAVRPGWIAFQLSSLSVHCNSSNLSFCHTNVHISSVVLSTLWWRHWNGWFTIARVLQRVWWTVRRRLWRPPGNKNYIILWYNTTLYIAVYRMNRNNTGHTRDWAGVWIQVWTKHKRVSTEQPYAFTPQRVLWTQTTRREGLCSSEQQNRAACLSVDVKPLHNV